MTESEIREALEFRERAIKLAREKTIIDSSFELTFGSYASSGEVRYCLSVRCLDTQLLVLNTEWGQDGLVTVHNYHPGRWLHLFRDAESVH